MSRFAVAGGGGQADLNSDADKLRSALHEVFTKIDEESVARPPARLPRSVSTAHARSRLCVSGAQQRRLAG